jgi:hypothetical protein
MKTSALTYISPGILAICILLIVTGSPILTMPVVKESAFPFGTLISWIGLIALTTSVYLAFIKIIGSDSSNHRIFGFAFKSIVILAALWGIIGFLLAGNWAFTFQNHEEFRGSIEASKYFWTFTAALVFIPVLLILIFWFVFLVWKLMKKINH